ncbi:MAG: dTDP-glucose 4,6-dehydratase [Fimbriimonadaceae bacterium]|nr:dTDP-glucose 4,6-dehydratase [Fimbriimonadaceae bacterium]
MKFLVTGGAGFIGSNYVRLVLQKYPDAQVAILDALTYAGNLTTIEDLLHTGRVRFYAGRIQDPVVANGLVRAEKPDYIVNFAAESHNDRSLLESGSFIQTDVAGVHTLLEATRDHGVERMLHVSTDEVYGTIDEGKFYENSPIMPNTPYSSSKAGGDLQARAHFISFKTPVVVTRGGNNYGPWQYPEKLIPFFVIRLLDGKKVPLYGEGTQVREWIHVMDHCEGIDAALHKGKPGEIYNIGDENNEKENREVVRILLEETGRDESLVKRIPDPRQGAHDKRYSMSTEKAQRELGWKPTRNFETSLKETVRWYKDNQKWWREIAELPSYKDFIASFYGKYLGDDL